MPYMSYYCWCIDILVRCKPFGFCVVVINDYGVLAWPEWHLELKIPLVQWDFQTNFGPRMCVRFHLPWSRHVVCIVLFGLYRTMILFLFLLMLFSLFFSAIFNFTFQHKKQDNWFQVQIYNYNYNYNCSDHKWIKLAWWKNSFIWMGKNIGKCEGGIWLGSSSFHMGVDTARGWVVLCFFLREKVKMMNW